VLPLSGEREADAAEQEEQATSMTLEAALVAFKRVYRHDVASYRAHMDIITACGGAGSEGAHDMTYPAVAARIAREMHEAILRGERPVLALRPQSAHLVPSCADADQFLYLGIRL
jgi:hypothetical protein